MKSMENSSVPSHSAPNYRPLAHYTSNKQPELLAPAGSPEKLRVAIHYGADAIFCGLSRFSLRAKASGFTTDSLQEARTLTHEKKKKLYITANIYPHNRDLMPLKEHALFLRDLQPDGIIVSDPGAFDLFSSTAPNIPIHISTQANITNIRSALFWEKMGAKRIVLSRELGIEEIREIRENTSIEIECFVHGSLCISYSGQCYLSSFMASRPANKGECANSCRWSFRLVEEKRPDEYFPIYEDDRGAYILSSRDLMMIEHLETLAAAGVDSFKLEGRMKGINYLAGVVKCYREAIDAIGSEGLPSLKEGWLKELHGISNRGYTTGLYFDDRTPPSESYKNALPANELIGIIVNTQNEWATVSLRAKLEEESRVRFLTPGMEDAVYIVNEIRDKHGKRIALGKNEETVQIKIPAGVREMDLIRKA